MLSVGTIVALPRLDAESLLHTAESVCISITNPRQHVAHLGGWHDVLRVGFHDSEDPNGPHQVFSNEQARVVLAFARKYRNRPICVHCEYGASRSYATGLFLADWLQRDLLSPAGGMPNEWVLQELRKSARFLAWKWLDWALLKTSWHSASRMVQDVTLAHLHQMES